MSLVRNEKMNPDGHLSCCTLDYRCQREILEGEAEQNGHQREKQSKMWIKRYEE